MKRKRKVRQRSSLAYAASAARKEPGGPTRQLERSQIALVVRAVAFAAIKHRDQRRRDGAATPYVNHVIAVADALANEGGIRDAAVICAALLHDVLEKTDASSQELRQLFGMKIADTVAELTDDYSLPKTERKQRQIDAMPGLSREAQQVRLADKLCNLRDVLAGSPVEWSNARKSRYVAHAQRVLCRIDGICPPLERKVTEVLELWKARTKQPPR
jgi:GTP diphosphokinase / guanosine-3',5'-bis(diphosphate) 3'-diphosphatase